MKITTRDLQRLLASIGYYHGGLDGSYGPKTDAAVKRLLTKAKSKLPNGKISQQRQKVMAIQLVLSIAGYEVGKIDGYIGPNTYEAFNAWDYTTTNKKTEIFRTDNQPAPTAGGDWPTYNEAMNFYGPVGKNQIRVAFPYTMKLAWKTSTLVKSTMCHTKVAKPMMDIFRLSLQHYGIDDIKKLRLDMFGGILNVRKMRGGNSWSTHSWGVACDLDPTNNQLRWGAGKATFSKPEYEPFWNIVESVGATSLGRTKNYDWMHFQFVDL